MLQRIVFMAALMACSVFSLHQYLPARHTHVCPALSKAVTWLMLCIVLGMLAAGTVTGLAFGCRLETGGSENFFFLAAVRVPLLLGKHMLVLAVAPEWHS